MRLKQIPGGRELILDEYRKLGRVSRGEWTVLAVFLCTAALWMFRGAACRVELARRAHCRRSNRSMIRSWRWRGRSRCSSFRSIRRGTSFALDWKTAVKLPWGVLLLFGGGLSLAAAMTDSGLARWIGQQVGVLAGLPTFWQIVLIVALIVFSGELTSNLAAVVALLPILFEVASGLELDPLLAVRARRGRRELRLHAARRHAAQRHRVRHGAHQAGPDGPGGPGARSGRRGFDPDLRLSLRRGRAGHQILVSEGRARGRQQGSGGRQPTEARRRRSFETPPATNGTSSLRFGLYRHRDEWSWLCRALHHANSIWPDDLLGELL